MDNNERLAEIIAEELVQQRLLKEDNADFKRKLASGNLKDIDWKFLLESSLEDSIEDPQDETANNIEKDEAE